MKRRPSSVSLLLVANLLSSAICFAATSDYPVFVAQVPNPNDYALFANSGWDGNWYVGFNNGWVKKLPEIPQGNYARAYVGAKLGRAKTLPPTGRPPQFNAIPGDIWLALSGTPSWTKDQRKRLATTDEIPLESNVEFTYEHAGEAQWFWVEVPMSAVNISGENYLFLWSPTSSFISISTSPVLAAAWGGKDVNTWLVKDFAGEPPSDPQKALSTGLSYFQPAMALKLIPAGPPHAMRVRLISWLNGSPDHLKPVLTASAEGESIERVWVEYRSPVKRGDVVKGNHWVRVGRPLWKAPYVFSLDQEQLPKGKIQLRVSAVNVWEEAASSEPIEIEVSPINAKK